MGLFSDVLRNALPLASTILLPIGFSIDKETGIHLSLGYLLNAFVGLTKIPYITTTLQMYLSLNSLSVLKSLFVGKYELTEPWIHLVDYFIVFMQVYNYMQIIIEPFLVSVFIRYINTTVMNYGSVKQFIVLLSSAVVYVWCMRSILQVDDLILSIEAIVIHILFIGMYLHQTEPITGPLLLLLYCNHLHTVPFYELPEHWSKSWIDTSSKLYKFLNWSNFAQIILNYHFWDMLLKAALVIVIGNRINGLKLLIKPLLLIMYTSTLMQYFYPENNFKEAESLMTIIFHVFFLVNKDYTVL